MKTYVIWDSDLLASHHLEPFIVLSQKVVVVQVLLRDVEDILVSPADTVSSGFDTNTRANS